MELQILDHILNLIESDNEFKNYLKYIREANDEKQKEIIALLQKQIASRPATLPEQAPYLHLLLGYLKYKRNEYQEAAKSFERAINWFGRTGEEWNEAICRWLLGLLLEELSECENAKTQANEAIKIIEKLKRMSYELEKKYEERHPEIIQEIENSFECLDFSYKEGDIPVIALFPQKIRGKARNILLGKGTVSRQRDNVEVKGTFTFDTKIPVLKPHKPAGPKPPGPPPPLTNPIPPLDNTPLNIIIPVDKQALTDFVPPLSEEDFDVFERLKYYNESQPASPKARRPASRSVPNFSPQTSRRPAIPSLTVYGIAGADEKGRPSLGPIGKFPPVIDLSLLVEY